MRLDTFSNAHFNRGRGLLIRSLWYFIGSPLLSTRILPSYMFRRLLLRLFGARIGAGVVIKTGVRITYPWRLSVGDYSWIGESAWIDNLTNVTIGSHCCISQGVYLCTGNHNWAASDFALITSPIVIENEAWICAKASLAPGTIVGSSAIVGLGSVAKGEVESGWIYHGNPATKVARRSVATDAPSQTLLCINDSFPPDIAASGQYLYDFARTAESLGHRVNVVCASRDRAMQVRPIHETPGMTVRRIQGLFHRKGGKLSRILSALYAIAKTTWHVATCPRPSQIIALSSPPLAYVPVAIFAFFRRIPLSLWIMDINPDQVIASGWLPNHGFLCAAIKGANRIALRSAIRIVTLDEDMKNTLIKNGADARAIQVLPLWPPSVLEKIAANGLQPHYNDVQATPFPSPMTVMYAGNLSLCHPLTTLLEAADRLRDEGNIRFIIAGDGAQKPLLQRCILERSLKNVLCMPAVSYEELPRLLESADLHIVSFGDPYHGIVHPSKALAIAKAHRPFIILGDPASAYCMQWNEYSFVSCVRHGDVEGMVQAIKERLHARETDSDRESFARFVATHDTAGLTKKLVESFTLRARN